MRSDTRSRGQKENGEGNEGGIQDGQQRQDLNDGVADPKLGLQGVHLELCGVRRPGMQDGLNDGAWPSYAIGGQERGAVDEVVGSARADPVDRSRTLVRDELRCVLRIFRT